MKKVTIVLIAIFLSSYLHAQENTSKIGWFISPEVGGILHEDHFGKTLGASLGIKILKNKLKVGLHAYGRPGPINAKEYTVTPSDGQTYKGQSTITLRADHGVLGLYIAPIFNLSKIRLELPVSFGTMGGGFYLLDDDRYTPDGDRVSVWEDRLMNSEDAGTSIFYEFGGRVFLPLPNQHVSLGLGLHYTLTPDYEAYADPSGSLYNNRFRVALILSLEN